MPSGKLTEKDSLTERHRRQSNLPYILAALILVAFAEVLGFLVLLALAFVKAVAGVL